MRRFTGNPGYVTTSGHVITTDDQDSLGEEVTDDVPWVRTERMDTKESEVYEASLASEVAPTWGQLPSLEDWSRQQEVAPGGADVTSLIERLGRLRDQKLITDAEFESKKTELLQRM